MPVVHAGEFDRRGDDGRAEGRVVVGLWPVDRRGDLLDAVVEGSLDLELGLRRGAVHKAGDGHAHSAKAVEDVDLGAHLLGDGVGDGLEHRVDERGENVVDFRQEEGEEAVVAIAEDGEEGGELVEVVTGSKGEWLRI